MDMILVDPKLFVTCRLCLEELGQYQIVPSVQNQIKYCFDINVEPFDGLPQLICLKCKETLDHIFGVKKLFCEKQENLRNNLCKKEFGKICLQPQQDAVSSSQQTPENEEDKKTFIKATSTSESDLSSITTKSKKRKKKCSENRVWESGFTKEYVCMVCDSKWSTKRSFYNHNRVHSYLRSSYPTIFKRNCLIKLERVDEKPNFTGTDSVVVHRNNHLIENCNSLYFIKYSKQNCNDFDDSTEKNAGKYFRRIIDSDSSSDNEEILAKPKRCKRRALSRSSNETVVIESNKAESDSEGASTKATDNCNTALTNEQCISIDSSDSDTERSNVESLRAKQPVEAKLGDYKIIQGIITMCVNAYNRKIETDKPEKQGSSESQLKRKVLGIGRKIINRQGFNWTGLLKYLEHKNLNIIWVTKAFPNINIKETNHIRIMTKICDTESVEDNSFWEPVISNQPEKLFNILTTKNIAHPTVPCVGEKAIRLPPSLNNVTMVPCPTPDSKSYLLNANPVANPKQLRKSGHGNEMRISKGESCAPQKTIESVETCMPIIMSTTSLSVPVVEGNLNESTQSAVVTEKPAPRIRVKPANELMSERTLNNLRKDQSLIVSTTNMIVSQNENINTTPSHNSNNPSKLNRNAWVLQSAPNMYLTPNVVSNVMSVNHQPLQLVQLSCLNVAPAPVVQQSTANSEASKDGKDEYVLLNSIDLPHTKTKSPFTYLKNLLQLHNLTLLDTNGPLTQEFCCLIKFKVKFTQDPIDPVFLCVSLHYFQKQFCCIVKHMDQTDVKIDKMSPNWQWEILKVFQGEIVLKILDNAQKHGHDILNHTTEFICLLRSIEFTTLT